MLPDLISEEKSMGEGQLGYLEFSRRSHISVERQRIFRIYLKDCIEKNSLTWELHRNMLRKKEGLEHFNGLCSYPIHSYMKKGKDAKR